MSNIRIKFVRGEEVKYISHLDLMKAFERALRRSALPIAYSQGFNPHPHMVFGLPMAVGVTSEAEYADMELSYDISPEEFTERLNRALPKGLYITDARNRLKKDNIMATISSASYDILVSTDTKPGINSIVQKIQEFLLNPVLMVKKEGKNGVRDIDIRPMIQKMNLKVLENKEFDVHEKLVPQCNNSFIVEYVNDLRTVNSRNLSFKLDNMFCISVLISAGSVANLKPDLLVLSFNNISNCGLRIVKIHRTGLFIGKEGKVMDPLDPAAL